MLFLVEDFASQSQKNGGQKTAYSKCESVAEMRGFLILLCASSEHSASPRYLFSFFFQMSGMPVQQSVP
jgi:hypothetical protein